MNIISIFDSLRAGQELANAETWKRRQVAINNLVVLLTVGFSFAHAFGYAAEISQDQLVDIASGVYGLVGLFNTWATVATTKKIGLPPKADPESTGRYDGGGYPELAERVGGYERDTDDNNGDSFPLSDMRDRG